MVRWMREAGVKPLRRVGVVGKWLFRTVARVVGIQSHGVDPNGADYLYNPRPPEYRP